MAKTPTPTPSQRPDYEKAIPVFERLVSELEKENAMLCIVAIMKWLELYRFDTPLDREIRDHCLYALKDLGYVDDFDTWLRHHPNRATHHIFKDDKTRRKHFCSVAKLQLKLALTRMIKHLEMLP